MAQRIFRKEVKWIGGLDASSNPRDGPSGQSPGFTPGTQTSTGSDYGDEVFKGRCLSRFVLSDLPSQSSGRTCVFLHFYFILFFSAIAVGDGVDVFMSMGIDFWKHFYYFILIDKILCRTSVRVGRHHFPASFAEAVVRVQVAVAEVSKHHCIPRNPGWSSVPLFCLWGEEGPYSKGRIGSRSRDLSKESQPRCFKEIPESVWF